MDLTVSADCTTGLMAHRSISSTDISNHYSARLWVKSSVNTNSGEVRLVLDETANCASPDETLQLPVLTANTWTQPAVRMGSPYGGTPPVDSTTFNVTLAREKGADLVIERATPAVLDTTMDLR